MTNDQAPTTNSDASASTTRLFDLAERTAGFGEDVIRFTRSIRRDAVTMPLISQLVQSGTSIGVNYLEADEAGSKKEFKRLSTRGQRDAVLVANGRVGHSRIERQCSQTLAGGTRARIDSVSNPPQDNDLEKVSWSLVLGHWSFYLNTV
jgi:hypothetical protein